MEGQKRSIRREITIAILISAAIQLILVWMLFLLHYVNAAAMVQRYVIADTQKSMAQMDAYLKQQMNTVVELSYSNFIEAYAKATHARRYETYPYISQALYEMLLDQQTVGCTLLFEDDTSLRIGIGVTDYLLKDARSIGGFQHWSGQKRSLLLWSAPIYGNELLLQRRGDFWIVFDVDALMKKYFGAVSACFSGTELIGCSYDLQKLDPFENKAAASFLQGETGTVHIDGDVYVYAHSVSSVLDCDVLALYKEADMIKTDSGFLMSCALFSLIICGISSLVLFSLQTRVSAPINGLCSQVRGIRNGSQKKIGESDGSFTELDYLADEINKLLDTLAEQAIVENQLQQNLLASRTHYMQEQALRMQTQINPHFLYNNLECIRGMARDGAWDIICRMSTSMARIYAYAARRSALTAALQEELQCVKEYETIIELRYDGQFRFECAIAPECLDMQLPRMTLQPVCENSVIHGRRMDGTQQVIRIAACVQGEYMELTVCDNGRGIPQKRMEELNEEIYQWREKKGEKLYEDRIGLINISQRLFILYGKNSSIHMEQDQDNGTLTRIRIPKRLQETSTQTPDENTQNR